LSFFSSAALFLVPQNWLPLHVHEGDDMTKFIRHIEAIIYATREPVNAGQIAACLSETLDLSLTEEEVRGNVKLLMERYKGDEFVFEIAEIDGGYVFLTKGQYHKTIEDYLKVTGKKKLSRAALETLAIIAYKQPITKGEVEEIRGVSVDYTIKKLLEKELIDIRGRSDAPGRPIIYETSERFMDYFGLKSKNDLPKLKEIVAENDSIGAQIEIEEEKQ
jgi:segregation and condensation protein B